MNIEKTTHSEKFQRYCKLAVGNMAFVTVLQYTSPVNLRLRVPTINCLSLDNESNHDFVQAFGEALQQAAAVAREWSQDTGKDFREVLPQ